MKIFFAYLLLVIVGVYKGSATDYEDCEGLATSPTGKVTSVEVEGCPDGAKCPLPVGTNKTVSFTFVPSSDAQSVTAYINGTVSDLLTPECVVPNADACASKILECPLKSGQTYTYNNSLEIPLGIASGLEINSKWELKDESGNDIICIVIPSVFTES